MARKSIPPDRSPVPLRNRLPNPPAPFVGREAELAAMTAAIDRGPVVVLVGPGGIGKTALALEGIHRSFSDRVGRTVYVGIRPGEPTAQLRRELVRLLAQVAGARVDLAAMRNDPEAATEAAIDLAESGPFWVLLDDVHHADADEMRELLVQLGTYARASRFIVTSRMDPRIPELASQIVEVHAMDEPSLTRLAEAFAPKRRPDELRRAVRAATGSPWLLQQYASMGEAGLEVTRDRLLEGFSAQAADFLRALAVLHVPFALEVLALFAPRIAEDELAQLERRGLVQRAEGGWRVHDVVRGLLFPEGRRGPAELRWKERASAALASHGDPDALLEAMRLLLELGAVDALADLVDRTGEVLLAGGFAPRLWRIVADLADPRLVKWRLRCAAELGNPTALAQVGPPVAPSPADRLAWARKLHAQGDVAESLAQANEVRRGGGDLAATAALLEARCRIHRGEIDVALRDLAAISATDADQAFRRDALAALAESIGGTRGRIDALVRQVRRWTDGAGTQQEAALDIASALHLLGKVDAADEVLDLVLATPRGGRASLLVARQAMLLRARMRIESGHLGEGAELLDTIRAFARASSLLRPFVLELDLVRRLAEGDLEDLDATVTSALRESARVDVRCWHRVRSLALRFDAMRARDPSAAVDSAGDRTPEGVEHDLVRATYAVRTGSPAGRLPSVDATHGARVRVRAALFSACERITVGDAAIAAELALDAARVAGSSAQRLLEAEAVQLACDALVCDASRKALADAAGELAELADFLGSERLRFEAELYLGFEEPAVLERVASQEHVAPAAARRARALLGGASALDRIDRAVVEAMRARAPSRTIEIVGAALPASWQAAWGLDGPRRRVWLPDGRVIDLSTRPLLWRILEVMADGGGAATKEDLVLRAWQEREYHPMRHDPRLHVSVRKLRQAIEDDASEPQRLSTTEDGYRFGGLVRRVR